MAPENNNFIYLDQTYIHTKSGGKYIVTGTCKIKINGEWVDGISYEPGEPGLDYEKYNRTTEDFHQKFTMEPIPKDHHDTKSFSMGDFIGILKESTCQRIAKLQSRTQKDDYQVLAAITEEHGELAAAMSIEDKLHGKSHKTCDEPATHEAVDVVITALALFFQRGGTEELLNQVINNKLDKWEHNIKIYGGPHGENCTNYLVGNCEEVCEECKIK